MVNHRSIYILFLMLSQLFWLNAANLRFSQEEQQWIEAHPVLRVGVDSTFAPYDYLNSRNEHQGLAADYLKLVAEQTGIHFEIVPGLSWPQVLEQAKAKELDVVAAVTNTPNRAEYLKFTAPYIFYQVVIFTNLSYPKVTRLAELKHKRVAMIRSYAFTELALREAPEMEPVYVDSVLDGLNAVTKGEAVALLCDLGAGAFKIRELSLTNIKVAGFTEIETQGLCIGVRDDSGPLVSILDKALKNIEEKKRLQIRETWIGLNGVESAKQKPLNDHSADVLQLTTAERKWLRKHPIWRLASEPDFVPFNFRLNEMPVGYSIDYMNLIADKLGIELDYVRADWNKLLELGREKQLDVISNIYNTPIERREYLNFTRPYKFCRGAITVRKEQAHLDSIEAIRHQKIGVVAGDAIIRLVDEKLPHANITRFDNYTDLLSAVGSETIDAALSDLPTAAFLIHNFSLDELIISTEIDPEEFQRSGFCLAVRKDWKPLVAIIEKAMGAITEAELDELDRKWLSLPGLRTNEPNRIKLTKPERDFINNNPTLLFGYDRHWAPIEFTDQHGAFNGMASDFLELVSDYSGLKFKEGEQQTWSEAVAAVKSGEIQFLTAAMKTPERSKFLNFTKPYISSPIVVITRNDAPYFEDLSYLSGRKVAAVKGYASQEIMAEEYRHMDVVMTDTEIEALELVSKGQAFAYIGSLAVTSYVVKKQGLGNLKVTAWTPYKYELCMAVNKEYPLLFSIIDKALRSIPPEQKSAIEGKWVDFSHQQQLTAKFPWRLVSVISLGLLVISIWANWLFVLNKRLKLTQKALQMAKVDAEQARDQAVAANRAKSEFLANMSHEIRTPMNAVLGFAEILKVKEKDPSKLVYVKNIFSAGQALLNLINDILDLSKIEAGKLTLQYSSVSLELLCREMEAFFDQKATEKGLALRLTIDAGVPDFLILDETRVRQLLINLIGNALKFTEHGAVTVAIGALPAQGTTSTVDLQLTVTDTGIGIPADQQRRIFEAFEQTSGQKFARYGGTGLGLAICNRLIRLMGGTINVESEVDQGTQFSLTIPDVEIAVLSKSNFSASELLDLSKLQFEKAKLLIADDIDYNRELLKTFLEPWGFELIFAKDGRETLEQVAKHKPDLILLDIVMPELDGIEVAKQLRQNPETVTIPIIAVSASATSEDQAKIRAHCDSYVSKPISCTALTGELVKYLNTKTCERA